MTLDVEMIRNVWAHKGDENEVSDEGDSACFM